ncbi:M-phase inducer phosphatase 2 [Wickerhamomyces ciferrii]|uniref:M-phase inducer phosphatase 2 n=1 Tax=Wickerhamomyces ciferrii (strain ATCC 14091 / BCRC 22168 / CBS 111 / JCM 3599 / NBRC 0793 / NRRL Y-1031 F-60-10) TaxID=1206466 RepID=K0KJ91_WICCF|nr:M-phase inducer phosphatase 2 [Wickerhamomyces ciferrii]CCH43046.1 M-phase inducer phosphatase 2 [Wickerhamomyces ciferrii]
MDHNIDHLYAAFITRLAPDTLKPWLLSGRDDLVVVDVRDSDYKYVYKACLPSSINIPAHTFKDSIPELLNKYPIDRGNSKQIYIFHCMRSHQRGPSSARKFLRYLLLHTECGKDFTKIPKIYILDGGLKKWNHLYGGDKRLMIPLIQN